MDSVRFSRVKSVSRSRVVFGCPSPRRLCRSSLQSFLGETRHSESFEQSLFKHLRGCNFSFFDNRILRAETVSKTKRRARFSVYPSFPLKQFLIFFSFLVPSMEKLTEPKNYRLHLPVIASYSSDTLLSSFPSIFLCPLSISLLRGTQEVSNCLQNNSRTIFYPRIVLDPLFSFLAI